MAQAGRRAQLQRSEHPPRELVAAVHAHDVVTVVKVTVSSQKFNYDPVNDLSDQVEKHRSWRSSEMPYRTITAYKKAYGNAFPQTLPSLFLDLRSTLQVVVTDLDTERNSKRGIVVAAPKNQAWLAQQLQKVRGKKLPPLQRIGYYTSWLHKQRETLAALERGLRAFDDDITSLERLKAHQRTIRNQLSNYGRLVDQLDDPQMRLLFKTFFNEELLIRAIPARVRWVEREIQNLSASAQVNLAKKESLRPQRAHEIVVFDFPDVLRSIVVRDSDRQDDIDYLQLQPMSFKVVLRHHALLTKFSDNDGAIRESFQKLDAQALVDRIGDEIQKAAEAVRDKADDAPSEIAERQRQRLRLQRTLDVITDEVVLSAFRVAGQHELVKEALKTAQRRRNIQLGFAVVGAVSGVASIAISAVLAPLATIAAAHATLSSMTKIWTNVQQRRQTVAKLLLETRKKIVAVNQQLSNSLKQVQASKGTKARLGAGGVTLEILKETADAALLFPSKAFPGMNTIRGINGDLKLLEERNYAYLQDLRAQYKELNNLLTHVAELQRLKSQLQSELRKIPNAPRELVDAVAAYEHLPTVEAEVRKLIQSIEALNQDSSKLSGEIAELEELFSPLSKSQAFWQTLVQILIARGIVLTSSIATGIFVPEASLTAWQTASDVTTAIKGANSGMQLVYDTTTKVAAYARKQAN